MFQLDLYLTLGLLSVLIAMPFILIQWNIKRLLAYSSIEHVGIMAVGVGLGAQAGVFGALVGSAVAIRRNRVPDPAEREPSTIG